MEILSEKDSMLAIEKADPFCDLRGWFARDALCKAQAKETTRQIVAMFDEANKNMIPSMKLRIYDSIIEQLREVTR